MSVTKTELPDGTLALDSGNNGGGSIRTLDQLLDAAEVDRELWDVERNNINVWETTLKLADGTPVTLPNWQVKAWLRPAEKQRLVALATTFGELLAEKKNRPRRKLAKVRPAEGEGYMLEVDLFDLHVGLLAWGEETGGVNWDGGKAEAVARDAVATILERAKGYNIVKVLLPMGNDLLHTDSGENTTTSGTRQDVDSRYLKMYRRAVSLMVDIIDTLEVVAPVEVLVIPGNHDRERTAYLGETLSAWYRDDFNVTVDTGAKLRKYISFGNVLLGFTHGSEEKMADLPLIMAAEAPSEWGRARYREFHTGHTHRRKKFNHMLEDTYNGVTVRVLPSLVPPDAWHASKGYVGGGRSCEAYLWGEKTGLAGYLVHSLPDRP